MNLKKKYYGIKLWILIVSIILIYGVLTMSFCGYRGIEAAIYYITTGGFCPI